MSSGNHLSSEQQVLDLGELNAALARDSELLSQISTVVAPDLHLAMSLLNGGICKYVGLCQSNPGRSCKQVMTQPGVGNLTALPDALYWIVQPVPPFEHGVPPQDLPPIQIMCVNMQSSAGVGWTLLFDDTKEIFVKQKMLPYVGSMQFQEYLVFTDSDALNGGHGKQGYFYNVDVTHLDHPASRGFSMDELLIAPWVGTDQQGQSAGTAAFPLNAAHYRFKYLGQPGVSRSSTLFILDDGNIEQGHTCKDMNLMNAPDECYYERADSYIPQVCYSNTPNGIISMGCSNDEAVFTQCGTCVYRTETEDVTVVQKIQESVVRRMYAR
jgi:hypothetical protein